MDDRHEMLVASVAVILHPGADSPALTGTLERGFPGKEAYSVFRYQVLRVWELPVDAILDGGLGTLPLAPLANVTQWELPGIVKRIRERLQEPADVSRADDIWAATYVLIGLRYSEAVAQVLLRGVLSMKESVTYQAILREGHGAGVAEGSLREAKALLVRMGRKKFGEIDASSRAFIEAITDLERVESLADKFVEAESWPEFLGTPRPRRSSRKGKR